jgi:hypothetical protein
MQSMQLICQSIITQLVSLLVRMQLICSRNVNAAIDGIEEAIFSQAGEGVVYQVQREFSSR